MDVGMLWSLEQIVKATQCEVLSSPWKSFKSIGTDTRQNLTGALFVALKGDQFDAHDFLDKAVHQGAHGLLIEKNVAVSEEIKTKCSVFVVKDTLRGLQDLAHFLRQQQDEMTFVAVTGSNGKTTTKEFAAQIISKFKKTHWSHSSFNNHWGVPLTLLQTPLDSEVVIVEMGMNHSGELTRLMEIAEPQAVVCTMVGRAHVEYFQSMEILAAAKHEVYEAANEKALRIYNLDNPWTFKMWQEDQKKFLQASFLTFSQTNKSSDIYFELQSVSFQELNFKGHILNQAGEARVSVFGLQNLTNLMAASALALASGLNPAQIWQALPQCQTSWGRNQIEKLPSGATLLFDAYNANPDSMAALLGNLKRIQVPGQKVVILGQMLELGVLSPQLHEELGGLAAQSDLSQVYFLGADGEAFKRGFDAERVDGLGCVILSEFDEALALQISQSLRSGDLIALKASRGVKLERFLDPLKKSNVG